MAFLPAASALAAGDLSSFADIMPLPASVESAGGRLPIDASLAIALGGSAGDARLRAAVAGAVRILEQRTGFAVHRSMDGGFDFSVATAAATLVVESAAPGSAVPKLYEDESYVLEISPRQAVLRAATTTGALRGLAVKFQEVVPPSPA